MKHYWIEDEDGSIDTFRAENMPSDFHNGPKCLKCGFEFCHHCNPEGYDTECGTKSIPADPNKTLLAELSYKLYSQNET